MDEITFSSLEELYNRLKPALKTKVDELSRIKFNIKENDIWKYLTKTKWTTASGLSLYQMVDDIMNVDLLELNEFINNS